MARPSTQHLPRRRELVAIAEDVFIAQGYRATTLADLLEAMGLSKGGFYHYFRSKDDVLRASMDDILTETEAVLAAAAALDVAPTARLSAVFAGIRELQARRGELVQRLAVILGDEAQSQGFYVDLVRRLTEPLSRIIQDFPVTHPIATAELLLYTTTELPSSPFRETYLTDPDARADYFSALRELVGRTLGIAPDDPCLEHLRG